MARPQGRATPPPSTSKSSRDLNPETDASQDRIREDHERGLEEGNVVEASVSEQVVGTRYGTTEVQGQDKVFKAEGDLDADAAKVRVDGQEVVADTAVWREVEYPNAVDTKTHILVMGQGTRIPLTQAQAMGLVDSGKGDKPEGSEVK